MAKRKPGRPTKYQPEMCDQVIEFGRQGMAIVEWAAELDVSRQTLHNWKDQHPEFLDAFNRAMELSEAWWMRVGRLNLGSREFNTPLYKHQVAIRHGLVERQEHDLRTPDGIQVEELTPQQLQARAAELTNRLAALSANGNGSRP